MAELTAENLEHLLMDKYKHKSFHLWLDRQTRPTVGVTMTRGVGRTRQEIGDKLFLEILGVLTTQMGKLMPGGSLEGVYLTYSLGKWQRASEFHIKAHLTTETFLTLADNLAAPKTHGLRRSTDEMKRREAIDHRGRKFREIFASKEKSTIQKIGDYHIMVSKQLNYPLLCLHQTEEDQLTANFSLEQLPNALRALEDFVLRGWRQNGFSIGMVMSGESFNVAAVIEEEDFARYTGKREGQVKEAWGWREPKRRYHPYQRGDRRV